MPSPRVNVLLQSMSLEEKVGQVFVLTWKSQQQAENELKLHPGGYIRIYADAASVARQTADIQSKSRIPLIIAGDFERGIGGTVNGALEVVSCMALGATGKPENAYDAAYIIGREAAAMGINMNFAPVLDINNNPANPVINTRSFGADPELVSRMGVAFIRGLQDAGIITCGKHFPGHGNSSIDSHHSLGVVEGSLDSLESVELVPFKAAIAAGVDSIMSAHLQLPCIDEEPIPSTLSKKVMTGLLRDELGFEGVAVTDALDMGAVANTFPPDIAIPMAINAGCDQLIMPIDSEAAFKVLLNAVRSGMVTEERLNQAVTRILVMKEKRGILDGCKHAPSDIGSLISTEDHLAVAARIAADSITLVKNNNGDLPLHKEQSIFCLQLNNGGDSRSDFLEPECFGAYLAADGWKVKTINLGSRVLQPEPLTEEVLLAAKAADIIVLAAYVNIKLSSGTIALPSQAIDKLAPILNLRKPVVLASFGSPYIINQFPEVAAYACAYGATQPSQKAMADALKALTDFKGQLPIDL